jgi:hypothetical protein
VLDPTGAELDATLWVEAHDGRPVSIVFESSGGTRDSPGARNVDYVAGLDLLLARGSQLHLTVVDAYIDTRATRSLRITERRLSPGLDSSYPVTLASADLAAFRRSLLRTMGTVGRARDVRKSSGGNARKHVRMVITTPQPWTAAQLADRLGDGQSTLTSEPGSPDERVYSTVEARHGPSGGR